MKSVKRCFVKGMLVLAIGVVLVMAAGCTFGDCYDLMVAAGCPGCSNCRGYSGQYTGRDLGSYNYWEYRGYDYQPYFSEYPRYVGCSIGSGSINVGNIDVGNINVGNINSP